MALFTNETFALPCEIDSLISNEAKSAGLDKLLCYLLTACKIIGSKLRDGSYTSKAVGSMNDFGDAQLDIDMKADAVMFECLRESKLVGIASSEENPKELDCSGTGFSVAFDPLDGSSVIDANFAVGTIIGVWPGHGLLNRVGRELSCSLVVQYGPRVTAAVALNNTSTADGNPVSFELTLISNEWMVSVPKISISPEGKIFAPGNLRATTSNPKYKSLVDYWIENKYTLRYSGGLVPDVYHILMKGKGVMSNASSKSCKAKLRLLYECAPIALIVEAAGGASCSCPNEAEEGLVPGSLLDVLITDLDRRIGVCYGSCEEVERFKSFMF